MAEKKRKRGDRLRKAVLRDEPLCRVCMQAGAQVLAVTTATVVPPSQGGRRGRSNLQPVCSRHAEMPTRSAALARILRKRLNARLHNIGG